MYYTTTIITIIIINVIITFYFPVIFLFVQFLRIISIIIHTTIHIYYYIIHIISDYKLISLCAIRNCLNNKQRNKQIARRNHATDSDILKTTEEAFVNYCYYEQTDRQTFQDFILRFLSSNQFLFFTET